MKTTAMMLCGLGLMAGAAQAGGTILQTFNLFDHPNGAIEPQDYGLRLDNFGGQNPMTFSFESDTGDSTVRLQVIDNEGNREIRIFGSMTGNSAAGGTDIGTFYLDVTYSVADNAQGWTADDPGMMIGSLVQTHDALGNEIAPQDALSEQLFTLSDGSGTFRFLSDGDRIPGDSSSWVGRGWVSNNADIRGSTNDFLFTAAVVPLPSAAWAGLAMLGGLGVARRLRK